MNLHRKLFTPCHNRIECLEQKKSRTVRSTREALNGAEYGTEGYPIQLVEELV
jgi:hypothetical protein